MTKPVIDINAPDIAARAERLSAAEIDELPFGVILLDREGIVRIHNATEVRESGHDGVRLGNNFFAEPLGVNRRELNARIARAKEDGPVDLEFAWKGDYGNPNREMRIRVQSARQGGVWLFIERD